MLTKLEKIGKMTLEKIYKIYIINFTWVVTVRQAKPYFITLTFDAVKYRIWFFLGINAMKIQILWG